jgi:hypothetical protein
MRHIVMGGIVCIPSVDQTRWDDPLRPVCIGVLEMVVKRAFKSRKIR